MWPVPAIQPFNQFSSNWNASLVHSPLSIVSLAQDIIWPFLRRSPVPISLVVDSSSNSLFPSESLLIIIIAFRSILVSFRGLSLLLLLPATITSAVAAAAAVDERWWWLPSSIVVVVVVAVVVVGFFLQIPVPPASFIIIFLSIPVRWLWPFPVTLTHCSALSCGLCLITPINLIVPPLLGGPRGNSHCTQLHESF